jgi:hypothetical protein
VNSPGTCSCGKHSNNLLPSCLAAWGPAALLLLLGLSECCCGGGKLGMCSLKSCGPGSLLHHGADTPQGTGELQEYTNKVKPACSQHQTHSGKIPGCWCVSAHHLQKQQPVTSARAASNAASARRATPSVGEAFSQQYTSPCPPPCQRC